MKYFFTFINSTNKHSFTPQVKSYQKIDILEIKTCNFFSSQCLTINSPPENIIIHLPILEYRPTNQIYDLSLIHSPISFPSATKLQLIKYKSLESRPRKFLTNLCSMGSVRRSAHYPKHIDTIGWQVCVCIFP